MKWSKTLIPTLKETPKDAEIKSHQLMLRAGLIRKLASGTYSYLPLGLRALKKTESIIREEMDKAGALEVLMPTVHPVELWQETGRLTILKDILFSFRDRHGRENVLGPTHEEVITDLVRCEVRSYRQLPLLLYQIQTKFRDEPRPRSGVIRSKEFIMKDAYSFHATPESLDETYELMKKTYCRIFERCGLRYYIVEADPGAMGGSGSQEFVLFSDAGEDRVVQYGDSDRVVSAEMAYRKLKGLKLPQQGAPKEKSSKVHTPDCSSVESLVQFFEKEKTLSNRTMTPKDLVKTMIYQRSDGNAFGVLIRGDRDVSDYKVRNVESGSFLASPETIEKLGSAFGFSGPFGLNGIGFYIDEEVVEMKNFVTGSNIKNHHLINVNIDDIAYGSGSRDFIRVGDYRQVVEGDVAPDGGKMNFRTAIELGHIFKLNVRYSEPMKAKFLDETGKEKTLIMGCYGIGVNRILAAVIEQYADTHGIVWPVSLSPYEALIVPTHMQEPEVAKISQGLYEQLKEAGVDVLLDDRSISPGIKFNDADLIGIPVRIIVGTKGLLKGVVEIKTRRPGFLEEAKIDDAIAVTKKVLDSLSSTL